MSEYELHIPHRGADQPVLDAIDDTRRALEGEDRALARGVLTERLLAGDETVGEVIEHLESLSSEERRAIADRARAAAGLDTISEIERRQEFARATRWPPAPQLPPAPQRDADGKAWQRCAASGCNATPIDPRTGAPCRVADRKWWCTTHRDQAGPEDHLAYERVIRVDSVGLPRESAEVEQFYAPLRKDGAGVRGARGAAEGRARADREARGRAPGGEPARPRSRLPGASPRRRPLMLDQRSVIEHEAGHVVGFLWRGVIPREVRVDRPIHPRYELAGCTSAPRGAEDLSLADVVSVAMGPLAEGVAPPRWKPGRGSESDEDVMAALVEYLDLSESDYNAACAIAAHLLDEPHIKAAHSLICSALSRVPVINERQLPELLGPHLDRFDIEPATAGEE